jgi:hypothetical protein
MTAALVLVAVVLVLVVFLARLVALLDEVDLTVRTLTTALRAESRRTKEIASAAKAIGRHSKTAGAVLGRLDELKLATNGSSPASSQGAET